MAYIHSLFPEAEIIFDIGSGLNYKRKGLRTILERVLCGDKLTIVVTCRDRLTRFGFELIEYLVGLNGGKILVLDQPESCPESELT
nr:recombinase family protein [Moorena sp. SIOASIH]